MLWLERAPQHEELCYGVTALEGGEPLLRMIWGKKESAGVSKRDWPATMKPGPLQRPRLRSRQTSARCYKPQSKLTPAPSTREAHCLSWSPRLSPQAEPSLPTLSLLPMAYSAMMAAGQSLGKGRWSPCLMSSYLKRTGEKRVPRKESPFEP